MSDQPEALRLADYLSAEEWPGGLDGRKLDKAATELRRLHKAEADFHMDYRMKCDAELKKLQAERDAAVKWLRFCLNECDDSPEWNFGTAAAGEMKAFLAAIDAARSKT